MDCEGSFIIERFEKGIKIVFKMKYFYIDRFFFGNIIEILFVFIIGVFDVDFKFCYKKDWNEFIFDIRSIWDVLGDDIFLNILSVFDFICG